MSGAGARFCQFAFAAADLFSYSHTYETRFAPGASFLRSSSAGVRCFTIASRTSFLLA
jgi:hypothetical protein